MIKANFMVCLSLSFTLSSCTSIKTNTEKNMVFENQVSWYFVSSSMLYRGRPFLLYELDDKLVQTYFEPIFSLLKKERGNTFHTPTDLAKQLRELEYNVSIKKKTNSKIYSKPIDPRVIGFTLKIIGKGSQSSDSEHKVDSECIKYEIPNISPPRFNNLCFISNIELSKHRLFVE